MTARALEHHAHDPEPPVGTVLTGGAPAGGDRVTLQRLESGWQVSYGGGPFRSCTYATVRSPVPEEWLEDLEESA